jgi:hypothetical protein
MSLKRTYGLNMPKTGEHNAKMWQLWEWAQD